MKFSVVIPCYNSAPYIRETLLSLNKQSFKEFEVIIVDDGSTDNSYELANNLFKEFLLKGCVVSKPQNMSRGVSSTRNYGISLATGDWIFFLDSDDYFSPEKIKVIHNLIEELKVKNIVGIHHAYDIVNETSAVIGENIRCSEIKSGNITRDLLIENIICTSTVAIKTSCLLKTGGFNEALDGVEDYFLWLELSKYGDWVYSPEKLASYRVRQFSLMRHRKFGHYCVQFVKFFNEIKKKKLYCEKEIREVFQNMEHNLLNFYIGKCLAIHGLYDVIKGTFILIFSGQPKLGFRIYTLLIKRYVSKWVKI